MKKITMLLGMVVFFFIMGNFSATSQVVVKVIPTRPKVIVSHPAKANPGHVWIDGHWQWRKKENKYVWIKCHWVKPNRPGSVWIHGHWVDTPKGHKYVPGYWKTPKALPHTKYHPKHRK